MKTIKQLLITTAMLLCSVTTYAYDFEVDGIYYNIISATDFTAEVTSGDIDYFGDVIIPSTVNYNGDVYSVTSIGEDAFNGCSSLTSIEIPNSIVTIGVHAFSDCSNLTNIEIPNSVTSIENYAFTGCTSLKELYIENGNTTLELGDNGWREGLFSDCPLETLYIGRNLSYDVSGNHYDASSRSPFYHQEQLETITISNTVTSIGKYIFYGCSSLTNIEIPNSVVTIGEFAFYDCSSLTSIEIPNSVTTIGGGAFRECGLTSIKIPDSVISIEVADVSGYHCGAFDQCCDLKTVTFGENSQLTSIGDLAFRGCTSLTSIEIPNSVTTIGGGAFYNCDGLTSIEIPSSVISIEFLYSPLSGNYGAFGDCSNLKTVTFEKNSQLASIGIYAFNNCDSLTNIEIPNSVTTIGGGAFYNCDGLTSIEIPSSVISIESHYNECGVFGECSNLKIVTFSENSQLASIGRYAFDDCYSLTSIEIPNSVTSIGSHAFDGCTSLKDLRIDDGYTTLELGYRWFGDCTLETIYLGRNISYDNSENPEYSENPAEHLLFDDMITLKTLTVGNNVTEIPEKTFYDCSNLESVYMRGVPPIIYDDTFSNTSFYIATLYVPKGTLAFYQSAAVWKNFWNIQEYEPTSTEDIETDDVNFTISSKGISLSNANNSTVAIYNINGVLVKKIDKYTGEEIILEKGVYIICVGDKAMKIKL